MSARRICKSACRFVQSGLICTLWIVVSLLKTSRWLELYAFMGILEIDISGMLGALAGQHRIYLDLRAVTTSESIALLRVSIEHSQLESRKYHNHHYAVSLLELSLYCP